MNNISSFLPLMIPSFSSKGNIFIKQDDGTYVSDNHSLLTALDTNLSKTYLLSAYDIFYGLIPTDPCEWPKTKYLFIDSGGYEINQSFESTERNRFNYHVEKWTPEQMEETYRRIVNSPSTQGTTVVISTFDYDGSFIEQLERAELLQYSYPNAIVNFLVKIHYSVQQLVGDISRYSSRLHAFKMIGFTEKELGCTVQERISNLILLRRVLYLNGWKGHIHLFGGLSPLLSKIYYFAGADIFDGLSWQRERYSTDSGLIDQAFFDISISEQDNRYEMMLDNLVFMHNMSVGLSKCSQGQMDRIISLEKSLSKSRTIAEILETLGVN